MPCTLMSGRFDRKIARNQPVAAANIQQPNSGREQLSEPVGENFNSTVRYQLVVQNTDRTRVYRVEFCVGRQDDAQSSPKSGIRPIDAHFNTCGMNTQSYMISKLGSFAGKITPIPPQATRSRTVAEKFRLSRCPGCQLLLAGDSDFLGRHK